MSNSQRREEKKRRREKRLAKRVRSKGSLDNLLHTLQHLGSFSEPRSWPGVADPSLSRPDRIKFELATFAEKGRGHDLYRQLERRLHQGLLHFIPEIEHWGMEEFFWHGLPGNPWHHPLFVYFSSPIIVDLSTCLSVPPMDLAKV